MLPAIKEFKSPTEKSVRVFSDDFFHSALVENTWTPIREDLWKAAYSAGCISKDMMLRGINKEEALASIKHEELLFEDQVIKAMEEILELGDPDTIDASGRPKVQAIAERVGRTPTQAMRTALFKKAFK